MPSGNTSEGVHSRHLLSHGPLAACLPSLLLPSAHGLAGLPLPSRTHLPALAHALPALLAGSASFPSLLSHLLGEAFLTPGPEKPYSPHITAVTCLCRSHQNFLAYCLSPSGMDTVPAETLAALCPESAWELSGEQSTLISLFCEPGVVGCTCSPSYSGGLGKSIA